MAVREPAALAALAPLEAALDVTFADPRLLLAAVTHRSYLNETVAPDSEDNERLEFLGDALIDVVAGDFLYRLLPAAREGDLTALRASLVCEPVLARFARELGLGVFLRLGRGEAASGGRDRPSVLCDAFEAVVGAMYLDRGFRDVQRFLLGFFEPELEAVRAADGMKDAKSRFQELAQSLWQRTPHYETASESGPDHEKRFVVEVKVGDEVWGAGEGPSKAIAARRAAGAALERLAAQPLRDT